MKKERSGIIYILIPCILSVILVNFGLLLINSKHNFSIGVLTIIFAFLLIYLSFYLSRIKNYQDKITELGKKLNKFKRQEKVRGYRGELVRDRITASTKDTISVIIPAYNEGLTIGETLTKIKFYMRKVKNEIIVINDCSTDNTGEILGKIKGIRVITHEENKGYGASIKDGILNSSGEWILITDADGTYTPESISSVIKNRDQFDMVVGARIGKDVNIPFVRKIGKGIVNKFADYIAKEKIPDLNSGLRIFRKDIAIRFFDLFLMDFLLQQQLH